MRKSDIFIIAVWIILFITISRSMWLFWLALSLFAIWGLISIAGAEKNTGYKIIWAFLVLVIPIVGPTLYYILEVRKRSIKMQLSKKLKKK